MASLQKPDRPLSIREMFREHLIVTNRKKRTIEAYISALEQFHNFIKKSPLKCTANDIRAFLFHLIHERGFASRTFNQVLYCLLKGDIREEKLDRISEIELGSIL